MKFAAVALVAAASVTSTSAQAYPNCVTNNFKPWVSSTDVTACNVDIAPYKLFPLFFPNATTYALFCKSAACQKVVYNTLAARPAEGDCNYTIAGVKVQFFATLPDDAVKVCNLPVTAAPPITTAPPPTTTAPPPTTTAPPPTTTAPPPGTTAPPPGTTAPPPTSTRPACA